MIILMPKSKRGCILYRSSKQCANTLTKKIFVKYALPCLERISSELKARHPTVPIMVFARDAPYALPMLQGVGYDVMTVDTAGDGREAWNILADNAVGSDPKQLQGNFDPALCFGRITVSVKQKSTMPFVKCLLHSAHRNTLPNLGSGLNGTEDPTKSGLPCGLCP